jgi:hypothetical protein
MQKLNEAQAVALVAKVRSRKESKDIGEKCAAILIDFMNDDGIVAGTVNDDFPNVENATLAGKFRQIVKSESLDELVYVSGSGGRTTLTKLT